MSDANSERAGRKSVSAPKPNLEGDVLLLDPKTKFLSLADVILAMRSVLRGEIYLGADIALKILTGVFAAKGLTGVAQLTDRELEIFRLIGCGAPTREIAERLHLGRPTVETYRRRIKTKLRLQSGSKLSHEAFRWVESGGQRLT